ncbi:hypothetical protein BsWGS_12811 [Bradybaena similaris]
MLDLDKDPTFDPWLRLITRVPLHSEQIFCLLINIYHRRFDRVPTVDNCDFEDLVCVYEANEQFYRDKYVDSNIVKILRQRHIECEYWEGPDKKFKCRKFLEDYEDAAANWSIKYSNIKYRKGAIEAYMKQKHRQIWERRNPDKPLR